MPHKSGYTRNSFKRKYLEKSKYGAKKDKASFFNTQKFTHLFLILIMALFSISALSAFFVNKSINKNFVYAESNNELNSDFYNFSYLSVSSNNDNSVTLNKLSFVLIDKISKKTVIINIPTDLKIEIDSRYKDVSIEEVFNISGLQHTDNIITGVEKINIHLLKVLGIKPNNFIIANKEISDDFEKLLYKGNENFVLKNIYDIYRSKSLKSNFNFLSLLSVQNDLNNRVSQDTVVYDLNETTINDQNYIDSLFESVSLSSDMSQEKKTISVLNGTTKSGIASFGARIINNNGGRVVSIDNAASIYDNSILIVDEINSSTSDFLIENFNISKVYTKDQISMSQEDSIQRSDVTLILGVDFVEEL